MTRHDPPRPAGVPRGRHAEPLLQPEPTLRRPAARGGAAAALLARAPAAAARLLPRAHGAMPHLPALRGRIAPGAAASVRVRALDVAAAARLLDGAAASELAAAAAGGARGARGAQLLAHADVHQASDRASRRQAGKHPARRELARAARRHGIRQGDAAARRRATHPLRWPGRLLHARLRRPDHHQRRRVLRRDGRIRGGDDSARLPDQPIPHRGGRPLRGRVWARLGRDQRRRDCRRQ
mmetsp:Transcript_40123/g.133800  ORF Transcript_40123/g.133800 Transcript_40123/m.133800 type:complete len:239 (+) Transcript_40123:625-1341(+)